MTVEATTKETVWMVGDVGLQGDVTFGPFKSKEEAERFRDARPTGYVYDAVQNRSSLCGPWLP